MADEIRCPMCSKNNPAGARTCQHCGARLAALDNSAATPAAGTGASNDPADWLKDLRITPADEGGQPAWQDAGGADDIPDWLADVRGGSGSTAAAPGGEPAASDLPDWMSDMAEPAQTDSPAGGAGMDDWLSSLREPDEAPQAPAAPAAGLTPDEQADSNDWLANLQSWNAPESAAEESAPAAEVEADPAMASLADGEDNLSAWLKSLDSEGAPAAPEQPTASSEPDNHWADQFNQPASARELPGKEKSLEEWLAEDLDSADQPAAVQPTTDASVPDWMSSVSTPPQESAPAAPAGDDLPDWLSGFASDETGQPAAQAAPADDFSSWLNASAQTVPAEPAAVEPAASTDADLPDWLSGFGDESAAGQPVLADSDALPNWFGEDAPQSQALPPEDAQAEAEPAAVQPPVDMPDFAAMFAEKPAEEAEEQPWIENIQPQVQAPPPQEPAPLEKQSSTPAFEPSVPDWLAAFAVAGAVSDEDQGKTPFIDPQQPDWLNSVERVSESAGQSSSPALFEEQPQPQPDLDISTPFQVDLPDWLDNPQEIDQEVEAEGSEEADSLTQADLPGWVQEMRPLESVIPGQEVVTAADQQRVEKAGPLAGMRGVLPSEEPAAHFRKLPAYSARLRVSERQHVHADLLQNVLDVETQPTAIPAEASSAPQYIYRLLIAAVLGLALLVGLVLNDVSLFDAPVPTSSDKGLLNLFNEIESVSAGAPVLVAVDYEAALSGEMRFAASAVLEHLMARGANLIIVSTVPAGPVLANDLLASVQQGVPAYQLGLSTVNLGYLPGGATSLLEFAQHPSVAAPMDYSGMPAWKNPALQGIQSIQDFTMILVLTDSVETGRAWVEQVRPVSGSVPLTMVSSAQAGPLLQPYLDAGQIKGLVNGLMGGAMYEQQNGKPGLANKDWNAYQLGYVAGILMLILGGVFSALRRVTQKPQKARG